MPELPEYLTEQTEENILQRMLNNTPPDLDKTEGSYIWDAHSPASIELALAAIWAREVLRRGFASTTFGPYLDLRVGERGITRKEAVKALGANAQKLIGITGTFIPTGTKIATPADTTSNQSSVEFQTLSDTTIGADGTAYVDIEAIEAGALGNVAVDTITILVTPIPGVTVVTNAIATSGGADIEDDASLFARYLQKVRSPSAGGNKADYVNWALEVTGVGGVSVIPVRDGPGTVSVAIIDTDKKPADQTLVDSVQNYIAPPWQHIIEAESITLGGFGTSIDNSQSDDNVDSVLMVYDANGVGTLNHLSLESILEQPGIWQFKTKLKVDNDAGVNDLMQIGIYNVSAAGWAKTTPTGSNDAVLTLKAGDMLTTFAEQIFDFYWNGQDELELRITRLQTDITTTVWVDLITYKSAFSKDTGEGKAPNGARVTVEPATSVLINVSAGLIIASGYNADSVKAAVEQKITDYIKGLAFIDSNDVIYTHIGSVISGTEGVIDYSNLLVNNGAANITIADQEVAVKGTVTL